MKKISFKKKIVYVLLALVVIITFSIYICDKIVSNAAAGKIYSEVKDIPYNKVGLLLGTSKFLANNQINFYYSYRITAAVTLLKAGKIKYVIISGDNGRKEYNEPMEMRADLINAGVDSTIIYLDYAGFRTFDSIVRLKKIFGQDSVTIISQQFHNERAIYIAKRENIFAIGFNARDMNYNSGFKVQVREKLARVKLFLDFIFGKKPKFLGEKITIP